MAANQTTGATKTNAKKPYVRIVTDKRREQNRRAQKAYRERLKKKLEVLEEQAASILPRASTEDSDSGDCVEAIPIHVGGDGDAEDAGQLPISPTRTSSSLDSRPDSTRRINLADAFAAAGDLPFGQGSLPGISFQVAPETPTPEPELVGCAEHNHDNYGDMDMRQIWSAPVTTKSHPSPPASLRSSTSSMTLAAQNRYRSFSQRPTVADPYTNHMRLFTEGNIEAALSVGLALRISRSQYLNDHPSHFPGCYVALNRPDPASPTNSISPITVTYRIADRFMKVTPELRDHLEEVHPPLRPTPAQLLNPHPTYLDCIVFPHFRELAVKASVDGILDHGQLFTDLMNGGLVCWGGMSGLANRHGRSVKTGKRDMRDSVAWSTRSWEAKKWFLKKWTWLIGTEEEEEARGDLDGIWRGSRWWWAMRGEEDSDEEDEDFLGERVSEVETGSHCL